MKHVRVVSRASINLGGSGFNLGNLEPVETIIILLLTVFFSGWDNFQSVISNLQKFYRKT